jgi:hypothetical protein
VHRFFLSSFCPFYFEECKDDFAVCSHSEVVFFGSS